MSYDDYDQQVDHWDDLRRYIKRIYRWSVYCDGSDIIQIKNIAYHVRIIDCRLDQYQSEFRAEEDYSEYMDYLDVIKEKISI